MTHRPPSDWPFLRLQKDNTVVIDLHVMPNAARTVAQGLHDGALRVRLHAPPVDGKANAELQRWLAQQLQVPRSGVELIRGQSSRRKQLRIAAAYAPDALWEALTPDDAG